ncbi:hypothetical protein HMN09_00898000 [Mycena chlorophos]|uniref:Transmembrane protein n=1 Tax=Mycena chlorophos TaxID=658473 RepID=A0A8H6SRI7_MYCCL|nr:hypothetical protein HMN09_00898000 [Mycena chlorophos]
MSSTWNFTFDDTSPFLNYSAWAIWHVFSSVLVFETSDTHAEAADGSGSGLGKGWTPWYSGSGFLSSPGEGGTGTSYHLTSLGGASVHFTFWGTDVYLYGDINNSSYTVALDGGTATSFSPSKSALLYSATGLQHETHLVNITATPTGSEQFAFDYAVIGTPYKNAAPSELFVDNTDTSLTYKGTWSPQNASNVPNTTAPHVWQQTVAQDASVSLQFSDAVGVAIYGMTDWGGWLFNVSVDGAPMQTFNGSTFWQVPDAMLFYRGGLDSTTNHTITLLNPNSDADFKLNLNSFRVFSAASQSSGATSKSSGTSSPASTATSTNASAEASTSKHSSVNAGEIVGPIIAVLVVVALVGWFFWRRRRSRQRQAAAASSDPAAGYQPHRPVFREYDSSTAATYPTSAPGSPPWVPAPYHDETTESNGPSSTYAPTSTGSRREKRSMLASSPSPPPTTPPARPPHLDSPLTRLTASSS